MISKVAKINSCSINGLKAFLIEIEVDIQKGLPGMQIVGLPDTAVKEAKERVKSAIINSGFDYPRQKITINLAPAHLKKIGTCFDLPIAIGILKASQQLNSFNWINNSIIVGELSLAGLVREVKGALLMASMTYEMGFENLILPSENKEEAGIIHEINVFPTDSLKTFFDFTKNESLIGFKTDISSIFNETSFLDLDFKDVKGQYQVKRAILVACAGYHNLLMIGPPGCGKTMLAKRVPSILPSLQLNEAIESTKIYSLLGTLHKNKKIITNRPFRNPHHTASDVAMVGGGSFPKPGEVSLAHNGVLFLDELPEFKRGVLEALREPIEENQVGISRAEYSLIFPSRFILIAAMNPCPCGYLNHVEIFCTCTERQKKSYISKLSGPLLDRIDIRVEVMKVNYDDILSTFNKTKINSINEENSLSLRQKVRKSWIRQRLRFKDEGILNNSQMTHKLIEKYCILSTSSQKILKQGIKKFNLSVRSADQILKLSRTVADLNERDELNDEDLLEVFQYRSIDQFIFSKFN